MPVRPDEKSLAAREQMAADAAHYLNQKDQEKVLAEGIKKTNTKIKQSFDACAPEQNGKHREVHVTLPDGKTAVMVQMQARETVSVVADIIPRLRLKLGAEAEHYIQKVEQLTPNALEQLVNLGKLTLADLNLLTTTSKTESLIVKVEK